MRGVSGGKRRNHIESMRDCSKGFIDHIDETLEDLLVALYNWEDWKHCISKGMGFGKPANLVSWA